MSDIQVAEYLIVTALYKEGNEGEAEKAVEWLMHPERRFLTKAYTEVCPGKTSTATRTNGPLRRTGYCLLVIQHTFLSSDTLA
jgi:hypothetical protein